MSLILHATIVMWCKLEIHVSLWNSGINIIDMSSLGQSTRKHFEILEFGTANLSCIGFVWSWIFFCVSIKMTWNLVPWQQTILLHVVILISCLCFLLYHGILTSIGLMMLESCFLVYILKLHWWWFKLIFNMIYLIAT